MYYPTIRLFWEASTLCWMVALPSTSIKAPLKANLNTACSSLATTQQRINTKRVGWIVSTTTPPSCIASARQKKTDSLFSAVTPIPPADQIGVGEQKSNWLIVITLSSPPTTSIPKEAKGKQLRQNLRA